MFFLKCNRRFLKKYSTFTMLLGIALVLLLLLYIMDYDSDRKDMYEQPFYRRTHNLNCELIFKSDTGAINSAKKATLLLEREYQLWEKLKDCSALKQRYFYPSLPLSVEEQNFPVAYSILVNEHLEQIQLLLNAIYMPQNLYCIHVDFKAAFLIHDAMQTLASCFPNVLVSREKHPVQRLGINMIRAFMSCLKLLDSSRINTGWKYVLTVQGHDFPLRTNRELVAILKIHNGANDVELLPSPAGRFANQWVGVTDEQGFAVNMAQTNKKKTPPKFKMYKGSTCAALSREFVKYILRSEKVRDFIPWLDDTIMGDELFWSTLNHDEQFAAPGGYPGRCFPDVRKQQVKTWISRFAIWSSYKNLTCKGKWRHAVCTFSVEDLPLLSRRPELLSNKFWLPYDPAALYCMHELLFNRTYILDAYSSGIDEHFYKSLPAVKYQNWRIEHPKESSEKFHCVFCENCLH